MSNLFPSADEASKGGVLATAGKAMGKATVFNDTYEIFFEASLPRYYQNGVKAYQARSVTRGTACIAYVCDRTVIPRIQTAEKYTGLQSLSLARLVSHGVANCQDGFQRYVFLYENNIGQPIVPGQGESLAYGWRSEQVLATVLKPLAQVLREMHNADLVHGGLRVENLFDGGTKPIEHVVVGDCLAQSCSSAQPTLYLSPDRAVAQPTGRGYGNTTDDLYALGVICAVLLRGRDPLVGKSDHDLIVAKLEHGTFSALIEHERLQGNMTELLRGLLQDDPRLRWNIDDVHEWLDGHRATPRQSSRKLKGSRHIEFGPHKVLLPSLFALYASHDTATAAQIVESGDLRQWIVRSIADDRLEERVEMAIESSKEHGTGQGYHERMVSRVCQALEPSFPILYKTIRSYPDSLGTVLAEIMVQGQDPKPIADLILHRAISFWLNVQPETPSDMNIVTSRFDQCQQFLKQRAVGYGIERCVYFLSPEAPCLSEKLRGFYVRNPEDLLRALNEIGDRPDRPESPFDRHIIAFLSVRDRKMIDLNMPDLNASEKYRQIIGTISTMAAIQSRSKIPSLPSLTRWLQEYAAPVFERYHDRDLRSALHKRLLDLKEGGQIGQIAETLLSPEIMQRDQNDFRLAMREYKALRAEDLQISKALERETQFGTQTGREIGALIAGLIMTLVVAGFVVIRFTQGGFGVW